MTSIKTRFARFLFIIMFGLISCESKPLLNEATLPNISIKLLSNNSNLPPIRDFVFATYQNKWLILGGFVNDTPLCSGFSIENCQYMGLNSCVDKGHQQVCNK